MARVVGGGHCLMVERLHRRPKDALRTRGANASWTAELPWVLLGLRSQPREDSNISPAQLYRLIFVQQFYRWCHLHQ